MVPAINLDKRFYGRRIYSQSVYGVSSTNPNFRTGTRVRFKSGGWGLTAPIPAVNVPVLAPRDGTLSGSTHPRPVATKRFPAGAACPRPTGWFTPRVPAGPAQQRARPRSGCARLGTSQSRWRSSPRRGGGTRGRASCAPAAQIGSRPRWTARQRCCMLCGAGQGPLTKLWTENWTPRCVRGARATSPQKVPAPCTAQAPLCLYRRTPLLATCVAGGGKAPGQRFRRISAYRRLDCGQRLVKASDRLVRSSADLRKSDHTADSSGAAQFDGYVGSSAASPATHSLRKLSPSPPAHRSAAGALDPFSPQFAPR